MDASEVLSYYRNQTQHMVGMLQELVKRESPSTDKLACDRAADLLETELTVLPVTVERILQSECGDFLVVTRAADGESAGGAILLLTHMDTVWPVGELARRPFTVDGDRLSAPGAMDDKSGQILLLALLQGLRDFDVKLSRPLVAVLNSDEEIGSVHSRSLIQSRAEHSDYALCLEPTSVSGALVTSRKAVGRFFMRISGRSAHSGVSPEKGLSAVDELARQVLDLHALNDPDEGISVNVGVISGGVRANMVAAEAVADVDLRAPTLEAAERLTERILAAKPHVEGITVTVTGGITRPPMVESDATTRLFELARTLGGQLGLDISKTSTGGGSDASLTSALGVPSLDGLGPQGGSAHAQEEFLLVSTLAQRAALLMLLVEHLANQGC